MAQHDYIANRTGLLLVDPYNEFLSDRGKLWPDVKAVAESVELLQHLRALVRPPHGHRSILRPAPTLVRRRL